MGRRGIIGIPAILDLCSVVDSVPIRIGLQRVASRIRKAEEDPGIHLHRIEQTVVSAI